MTGAELVRMEGREGGPEGHTRAVTLVVFVRDGEQLVSASIDRSIRIWDVSTGTQGTRWPPNPNPSDVELPRGCHQLSQHNGG